LRCPDLQVKHHGNKWNSACQEISGAATLGKVLFCRLRAQRCVFQKTSLNLHRVLVELFFTDYAVLKISFEFLKLIAIDGDIHFLAFKIGGLFLLVICLKKGWQQKGECNYHQSCTN
jgi:hypothetical protein